MRTSPLDREVPGPDVSRCSSEALRRASLNNLVGEQLDRVRHLDAEHSPRSMHCLGNIIYAAQVDFDRALRMIVLDHLIDKGDEMFLEHREGTGVEVAI